MPVQGWGSAAPGHGGLAGEHGVYWSRVVRADADLAIAVPWLDLAGPATRPTLGDAFGAWFRSRDFARDLAEDIGSPRWYRGFALMLALMLAGLLFWPGLAPMPAASARLDRVAHDELRARSVLPIAFGSATGHRAGAGDRVVALNFVPERPQITLAANFSTEDSLGRMLHRAGLGAADAAQAEALVATVVAPGAIAPATRFDIVLGPRPASGQPRVLERMAFRAAFDLDLVLERHGGRLSLRRLPIAVDDTPLRIRGVAGGSVYLSARAAGAPLRAIQQYLQAIDAHLSLDDVAVGDKFDMIVGYRRAASGEVAVGDLLYAGLEHEGQPRAQLVRWGGEGQFFDAMAAAEQRANTALVMPVAAGHLTSGFGMRQHPILGYARMHAGVDFGAPYGSPIFAVADGIVSFAGVHGGHGNYVRMEHGGGVGTGYGHMSRFAVAPGMRVRAGQVIGYVGSTGLSTGPHLHYEVFRDGRAVDPGSLHFTIRAGVDAHEFAGFKARLAQLLQVRPGAALGPIGAHPLSARR